MAQLEGCAGQPALFIPGSAPTRLQVKRWYRNPELKVILKVDADELPTDKVTEPRILSILRLIINTEMPLLYHRLVHDIIWRAASLGDGR